MTSRGPRFGYVAAMGVIGLALLVVRLAGYSAYVVTSGSMEPSIGMGSLVVVQPVRPESVRTGDVITYALPDRVVTHRVQAVMWSDGTLVLATRGDANTVPDPWLVHPDSEVGSVRATVPLIGFAIIDAQRWWRLAAVILLFSLSLEALLTRVRTRRRAALPQPASA